MLSLLGKKCVATSWANFGGNEATFIPSSGYTQVIDWSTYHKDDEIFQDENFRCTDSDIFTKWDRDFFKVETITLFEIILAANYLDVKGLLEMGCKTVADMMGGKSAEEIRRTFNIENDLTAEEEEQIRKENAWCEER